MLVPLLVFVFVVLVVFGAYWVVVLRPEQARDAAVRQRLTRPIATPKADKRASLAKEVERLSNVPAINSLLSNRGALVSPIKTLIQQADVKTTVGVVVLSSAVLFVSGLVAGQLGLHNAWIGLGVGALLAVIPTFYLRHKRDARRRKFEELFPEAIDLLSRALRAGHAFTTALGMVAEEMPQPIGGEFRLLYDRQNFGLPLDEAMRDFAERIPLLDARFFVTAVLTQRESGGNLSEVLDNLASVIRERFTLKRHVRAKSAHGRMTGWILVAMAPTLVAVFFVVRPDYILELFRNPKGLRMVAGATVLQVIGSMIIRKIVDIEI